MTNVGPIRPAGRPKPVLQAVVIIFAKKIMIKIKIGKLTIHLIPPKITYGL